VSKQKNERNNKTSKVSM